MTLPQDNQSAADQVHSTQKNTISTHIMHFCISHTHITDEDKIENFHNYHHSMPEFSPHLSFFYGKKFAHIIKTRFNSVVNSKIPRM